MHKPRGEKQEEILFDYLRFDRHCLEVIRGDDEVRRFIGMKLGFKCADALGLHQSLHSDGPRRITVGESKGKDMGSALEQLGNAAAGVFERFGRETKVDLLLIVPELQERPGGFLSPGPGYRAGPRKTGLRKFILQESTEEGVFAAMPAVTYPGWKERWYSQVSKLPILLLSLR